MNWNKLLAANERPELYKPGSNKMWNDEYISKQLLDVHLNPDVDLASRNSQSIRRTVDWILSHSPVQERPLRILDLGSGPGLYAEHFAKAGHRVRGVDISGNSVEYARRHSKENGLSIDYICSDYLEYEPDLAQYDLVIMIYTDYGVLTAEQRQKLLAKISRALRPGGVFIFDVLNDRNWGKARISPGWEIAPSGFWAPKPYIALFRPHIYEDEKVMLSQHIVIDEQETVRTYHFWTQFFSDKMLEQELNEYPFQDIALHNDVLPGADEWSGKNLTFCRCVRN